MSSDAKRTLAALWRVESPRLIGALARLVRDVAIAEDLAQEALVAALERWPRTGVPDKPAAWLMSTARHRAIDLLRRGSLIAGKHDQLAQEVGAPHGPDLEGWLDDAVGDDLLRLLFIACHPVLPPESRVALTLRLVGGLTTQEIARAFLVPEATLAQRIVRAKRTLSEARVPFELPDRAELAERLDAVLQVVYLIFNEGYAATAGEDLLRPALCGEALRLGWLLARLSPDLPEVHGLVALMELQSSRFGARTDPGGTPIPMAEQDRSAWDRAAIERGLASLARAEALGGALDPYALQAGIAACHARARTAADTDWGRIAALYDVLAVRVPQPVVALNRAVAHAQVFGPQAGLDLLAPLERALAGYHLLPTVRGDLLERLGRAEEARAAFEEAAALTHNERERSNLLARARRTSRE